MSVITECLKQDPRYLERRYREFRRDMEVFEAMVFRICNLAPPMIRVYKDGEFMVGLPDEWQKEIDNIVEKRNAFVKSTYPEFYE